jgi:cytidine deaminase
MTTRVPAAPEPDGDGVDWGTLRAAAVAVREHAYAPYSRFAVGAAGLTEDGRLLTGCNVENASIGMTLCAECGVVSDLHSSGGGRLVAIVCVGAQQGRDARVVLPCGRCRQLIAEQSGPQTLVDGPDGPLAMAQLLPSAFDSAELTR